MRSTCSSSASRPVEHRPGHRQVSDELEDLVPGAGDELRLVTTETRAGKPRLEAFRTSPRAPEWTMSGPCRPCDPDRSVWAPASRRRSGPRRDRESQAPAGKRKRRPKDRRQAGVPLVFFLFPALYVAVLGPAAVEYIRVFKGGIGSRLAGASFRGRPDSARRRRERLGFTNWRIHGHNDVVGFGCRRRIAGALHDAAPQPARPRD